MGFSDFDLVVLKFSILGSGRSGGGLYFLHVGISPLGSTKKARALMLGSS